MCRASKTCFCSVMLWRTVSSGDPLKSFPKSPSRIAFTTSITPRRIERKALSARGSG